MLNLMPAPPSPVSLHQRERAAEDRQARQQRIKRAREAYHGNAPAPLKPTTTRSGQKFDDNVRLNFARVIVDVGVDFLFGRPFERQISEDGETPEERYLADVWKANREPQFLTKLAQEGAVTGHAFVKIMPPGGGPGQAGEYARCIVLSSDHVEVEVGEDDCETATRYTIQWTTVRGALETVRRQTIEPSGAGWVTVDERSTDSGQWELLDRQPWPWPWPPIADCQNLVCAGEYCGVADLEPDVVRLNDAVNYLQSNAMRIQRFHGHPLVYSRGVASSDSLAVDPSRIVNLLGPDASLNLLQWAGDAGMREQMYRELVEALFQMARIPLTAVGKLDGIGQLSGTAMRILYQPLLAKTATKRATYGALLDELDQRLLELGGHARQPDLHRNWPEVLPVDVVEQSSAYQTQLAMGVVSKETVATNLGYDWPIEQARIEREQLGLPADASDAEVAAARAERDANLVAAAAAANAAQTAPDGPSGPQTGAGGQSGVRGPQNGAAGR